MKKVLLLAFVSAIFAVALPEKKLLAGPAAEFRSAPRPEIGRIAEHSVQLELNIVKTLFENALKEVQELQTPNLQRIAAQRLIYDGKAHMDVSLPVDSDKLFSFSLLTPIETSLMLELRTPAGKVFDLKSSEHPHDSFPLSSDGSLVAPARTFIVKANHGVMPSEMVGDWTLHLVSKKTKSLTPYVTRVMRDLQSGANNQYKADGIVLLFNESPTGMVGMMNTYNLETNRDVGLVAWLGDKRLGYSAEEDRAASIGVMLGDKVEGAEMEVISPSGKEFHVSMHDDGLHYDGKANDGVYGAFINANESGQYLYQSFFRGTHASGVKFVRSTQHLIRVVDDALELTGSVTTTSLNAASGTKRVELMLQVRDARGSKYHAYAEVWGVDAQTGAPVPACWIGGMMTLVNSSLPLSLDVSWLKMANAVAPYQLRNVFVQDGNTDVLLAQSAVIDIPSIHSAALSSLASALDPITEITEEMRKGPRPAYLQASASTAVNTGSVLLHGYCSETNVWENDKPTFTHNPHFYLDKKASVSNEEFAVRVYDYMNNSNVHWYTGLGHSQGGMALLQLKNYYWSGLDAPLQSAHPINSVGTPYNGCTGAGSAANLAKVFGVGCGSNEALSPDGAAMWLAGIEDEAEKHVYYYTTTYKLGNFFGDWCNIAVNLVLQWPNDGTAERDLCKLALGHNMGNTEKQCHTSDMTYKPQYEDKQRNAEINKFMQ